MHQSAEKVARTCFSAQLLSFSRIARDRSGLRLALTCLLAIAVAATGFAQRSAGIITGTVTDSTGAAVPGAAIELTGPSVPKGLATTSDDQGKYILQPAPIGIHTLSVSKPGFAKLVQRDVEVRIGSEITYNAKLEVSAVSEVIEVSTAVVSLDVTSSRTATNITTSMIDNLPRGRSFHTMLAMAPGVRQEIKSGNAGVGGFQVDGASGSENAFLIDGVDVSDVRRGSLRQQNSIPLELVGEIQIKSAGFEAEYGGATGGVVNVVTRSGSNSWHGVGMFQFALEGFNPRPRGYWKRSPANADRPDFFAPPKDNWRDLFPGFSVGGPILKDTLFFTAAYFPEFRRTERVNNYASGARTFTRDDTNHFGFIRLDASPTSKLQINSSWTWSPWKQDGALWNPDARVAPPTNNLDIQGGFQAAQVFSAGATYALGSRTLVSGRYGYKYQNDKLGNYGLPGDPFVTYVTASSASATPVPAQFQGATAFANVSSTLGVEKDITTRHNLYLDASHILNAGGQQHTLKFGYARARLANDISTDYTNGRFRIFWGDSFSRGSFQNVSGPYGYYIWEDGVRNLGDVSSRNQGFYVQDAWRVHPRLTLNLGVRFENEFLPPYKGEVDGRKVADPVSFGWGDKIAPRIGGAWDVLGDGKWKLAGSFGLFYDVLKYELARGSFGSDYWVSHAYRLDNPNVFALSKANPGAAGAKITQYDNRSLHVNAQNEIEGIDPDIKPYTSREFTATLSREIASRLVASVRYSHKDILKAIEDIGVLDAEESEVYLIGNPGFGQTRDTSSVYGQKTPNGGEFLVPKAIRQYDAVEFRLDGRFMRRLTGMASYTWSRLYGNYSGAANSDESGRSDPGVSRAYDLPYYYFDSTGSGQPSLGPLGTDRPHTLKLFGSYDLESKVGTTTFGLAQIAWSGTPDSTSVIYASAPTLPFGRGDLGRTPVLTQTDLSIQHTIKATERLSIRFEGYGQNLFNQAAVVARVTQINRAAAISFARLPVNQFFAGYNLASIVNPQNSGGAGSPPYNPIYGLPAGDYRDGGAGLGVDARGYGPTGYQAPRNVRFGLRFIF